MALKIAKVKLNIFSMNKVSLNLKECEKTNFHRTFISHFIVYFIVSYFILLGKEFFF